MQTYDALRALLASPGGRNLFPEELDELREALEEIWRRRAEVAGVERCAVGFPELPRAAGVDPGGDLDL